MECEPYLTADYRVMMERADEALQGALICAKATRAPRVIVGVELNKKDAIAHLKEVVEAKGYPIEIVGLKVKYPQGDEKQLLKALLNREIPSGKLPSMSGRSSPTSAPASRSMRRWRRRAAL